MPTKYKEFHLEISYPASMFPDYDRVIEDLIGESDGSGYGFGNRDMSWTFKKKSLRDKALRLLRAKKIKLTIVAEIDTE